MEKADTLKAVGNINLKAAQVIEVGGQMTAGNKITANSSEIKVFDKGSINADKGIDLGVSTGGISIEGSATTKQGDMKIILEKGNLEVGGKLSADAGEIEIDVS